MPYILEDAKCYEAVALAGCVMQNRLAVGLTSPVFVVLTGGHCFLFYVIDKTGKVQRSMDYCFSSYAQEGEGCNISGNLPEIIRWFNWMASMIKSGEEYVNGQSQM
jgi:hypothetical protein